MTVIETLPVTGIDTARPQRPRPGLVLTLACIAIAMVGLDMAIVNVALPSIQRDLGVGESALQWVVVAYSLLLGGFLLLGGRMTDRLGHRRMFLVGLTVFTAASFLAGAAPTITLLIAARGLQGFGAALVSPAALSLVAVTFPEGRERTRALGIFGGVGGAAGTVGVVASGLLTAGPGWRWAFFINVPIGLLLVAAAAVFLDRDRSGNRTTRLDLAGAGMVTIALLTFVYALHHAADRGWTAGSTVALFGTAAVLLAVFVRIEMRTAAPLVPPTIMRNRRLMTANLTAFLANSTCLSFIFVGSLLMQQALGYSPVTTGLAWLATTATVLPTAMVGARLGARLDVRLLLIAGPSLFTFAAVWLARVPAHAGYLNGLLPAFLCAGIGFGLAGPALQIRALAGVSGAESGLAAGLVETMREIGGAAGVAAVTTVLVGASGLAGFHAAFAFTAVLAAASVLTAIHR